MCKNFKLFNATYGPLNMDLCTDNSSTLGNFARFQVAPSTSAGWNIQTNAIRSDQIFYQKPSVCHYFIPSFHYLENTTSFCYFLVRNITSIQFGYCSYWGHSYQGFSCITVFVVGKCNLLVSRASWLRNLDLGAVNYNSKRGVFENHRHWYGIEYLLP